MAEVVERNIENSLKEILYMRKLKLFSKLETDEFIRKRRHHEYSIQKRNKRILDYDAYICTEISILKLTRLRRQVVKDTRYIDKIERQILSRLVRLHRSHIDLWLRFIKFLEKVGRHMSVVRVWNRVLQVHGRTEPKLWAAAAAYHLNRNPKSRARGDVRNSIEKQKKLRQSRKKMLREYNLLNHYTSNENKDNIMNLLNELNENCILLDEVAVDLERERRLAWDWAYLLAIREARRLLTEGTVLNPESDELHIELIKLEIIALDFFKTCVLPRYQNCTPKDSKSKSGLKRKRQTQQEKTKCDNEKFLTLVKEDVIFISSGGALKLVAETLLDRWKSNQSMLELFYQLILSQPGKISLDLVELVKKGLDNAPVESTQSIDASFLENDKNFTHSPNNTNSKLSQQLADLHEMMLTQGCLPCIKLWNSWYLPHSGSSNLRFINPVTYPGAVDLLRCQLLALQLYKTAPRSAVGDEDESMQFATCKELILKMRLLMDGLATSYWGSICPVGDTSVKSVYSGMGLLGILCERRNN